MEKIYPSRCLKIKINEDRWEGMGYLHQKDGNGSGDSREAKDAKAKYVKQRVPTHRTPIATAPVSR
jgi:hypothetical protein